MTEAGRGEFEATLRQRETELIRATRGTTMANAIAPRIDTGAFEDLSPRESASHCVPQASWRATHSSQNPSWHVRGARQRLESGSTEVSVKARNKVGGTNDSLNSRDIWDIRICVYIHIGCSMLSEIYL